MRITKSRLQLLSRITEKLVVSRWIRPAITSDLISDQLAFRPTGSTTCALAYFMHHVTRMLETNSFVRCLLVAFTKAFDVVDHVALVEKISKLKLPKCVLNWIIYFLVGRNHTTKTAGVESRPLPINLSIVQGTGIGPTLYIILESDLKPVSLINIVYKYADDTNLLVPEHTDVQLCEEFEAIQLWALRNKMIINTSKTKQLFIVAQILESAALICQLFKLLKKSKKLNYWVLYLLTRSTLTHM